MKNRWFTYINPKDPEENDFGEMVHDDGDTIQIKWMIANEVMPEQTADIDEEHSFATRAEAVAHYVKNTPASHRGIDEDDPDYPRLADIVRDAETMAEAIDMRNVTMEDAIEAVENAFAEVVRKLSVALAIMKDLDV